MALLFSQGLAFGDTTGWDLTGRGSTLQPRAGVQIVPQWPCSSTCTYDQDSVFRLASLNDASLNTSTTAPNLINKQSGARIGTCAWNSGQLLCSPTNSGSTGDTLTLDKIVYGTASSESCTQSFYFDWWDSSATTSQPDPNEEWTSQVAFQTTSGPCQ
ncbi:hypothetical protein [Streptomyces telluris]|uniref:Uncharacterized protein n=1 Tax=Streptomyces telluris TaxID=2720021 RepID=A0A9X2LN25_9ACTN|nr:hypothetical protein [Streptomyces telluris]MCQ8774198.1 hypothetical protein [Streptomyces telluris]NJP82083.1 hypothetical protein [Streptomyces telluris]